MSRRTKKTRLEELEEASAEAGVFVRTYSPGDGKTRYRLLLLAGSAGSRDAEWAIRIARRPEDREAFEREWAARPGPRPLAYVEPARQRTSSPR